MSLLEQLLCSHTDTSVDTLWHHSKSEEVEGHYAEDLVDSADAAGRPSFLCRAGCTSALAEGSDDRASQTFQPHSLGDTAHTADTITALLSDEGSSEATSSEKEGNSPTPEMMPPLDWCEIVRADCGMPSPNETVGVASPLASPLHGSSPISPTNSDDSDRSRRRYRRTHAKHIPVIDMQQQRMMIDAEMHRRREDHNAMMQQQQQLSHQHMHIAAKILCNEAHRRHVAAALAQVEASRRPSRRLSKASDESDVEAALGSTLPARQTRPPAVYTASVSVNKPPVPRRGSNLNTPQCIAAAWHSVADCVEDSLFQPQAVQARLSCMGIFRNNIKVTDLIAYDDHEGERMAIRMRQVQIIQTLNEQAELGGDPFFLETPFDFEGAARRNGHHSAEDDEGEWFDGMFANGQRRELIDSDDDSDTEHFSPTAFIPMGEF